MALKKALYYGAIAVAILIALSVVSTILSIVVGVTLWAISWAINLAVAAGVLYAAYKIGTWLFGSDDGASDTDTIDEPWSTSSSSSADDRAESRQDRIRRQYVEGQISEAEFERRIASELETEELDDIDRELERER